jgi:hypothetical protein
VTLQLSLSSTEGLLCHLEKQQPHFPSCEFSSCFLVGQDTSRGWPYKESNPWGRVEDSSLFLTLELLTEPGVDHTLPVRVVVVFSAGDHR